VPSKALIRAAESLHNAAASKRFDGIEATASVTDWSAVVAQKHALVDELRQAKYVDVLPSYNTIAYKEGKDLTVDGELLDVGKIIIATGSQAHVPEIPGINTIPYLTSTTALEMEQLPASLLVIGAGYIGVEIAQIFARAGVDVTIVSRRGLLPETEPEISSALTEYFQDEGIRVLTCNAYREIDKTNIGLKLTVDTDESQLVLDAEKLLVATGRTPNTRSLNLAAANIRTRRNHGIEVDSHMRTSLEGVYAAGDVTGTDQFVCMAAYGAKIAARNAMNGNSLAYDNAVMPAVVFTDPQVASVGLTEAEAKSQGYEARTSTL